MKNLFYSFIALMAGLLALTSLPAAAQDIVTTKTDAYTLPTCTAPLATLAVGKIACKAAACGNPSNGGNTSAGLVGFLLQAAGQPSVTGIGNGLGDMLVTALKQTNCFKVESMSALAQINKMMAEAGAAAVKIKPPRYMVLGAITDIDVSQHGGSFGGGLIPIIGSITHKTVVANLKLDMQIVDTKQATILDSKTFSATSKQGSFGMQGGVISTGLGFGGSYSSLNNTPLGNVARQDIVRAVSYLVDTIKQDQVEASGTTTTAATAPAAAPSAIQAVTPAAQAPAGTTVATTSAAGN